MNFENLPRIGHLEFSSKGEAVAKLEADALPYQALKEFHDRNCILPIDWKLHCGKGFTTGFLLGSGILGFHVRENPLLDDNLAVFFTSSAYFTVTYNEPTPVA